MVDPGLLRAHDVAARFRTRFGGDPRVFRAPGRVNLIGEHTDYNDGFVLPAAVALTCHVAGAPRGDRRLVVESEAVGMRVEWCLDDPDPAPRPDWSNYALGVAALLRRRAGALAGATLLVASDVPMGAGLSSSAAIEVAVALALSDLSAIAIAPTELAQLCQQAEIEFVGARVGVMDQFVGCHGKAGHAVRLDCRSLEHRLVPLPPDVCLVACNTMVRHAHAFGEYNRRRAECEAGVSRIAERFPHVRSLRDVGLQELAACGDGLPNDVFRRCRHVVTENDRVLQTVAALERDAFDDVGVLMAASHQSLRDDFDVSCPELDAMVEVAGEAPGVMGARMTGGGFGGCTVNLVHAGHVDGFRAHVEEIYASRMGRVPDIYVMEAGDGASRVL